MRNFEIIGLTGPTGSGKSIAALWLSQQSYSVIDADALAKQVLCKGSAALITLSCVFGEDIILPNGEADRRLIAQRAFKSPESTKLLNEIMHPRIFCLALEKIDGLVRSGRGKIVFDAPVLFESHSNYLCDTVISVLSDRQTRIERIIKRDNISLKQAQLRLSAQHDDEFYIKQSDFTVYNNGSHGELYAQLSAALKEAK